MGEVEMGGDPVQPRRGRYTAGVACVFGLLSVALLAGVAAAGGQRQAVAEDPFIVAVRGYNVVPENDAALARLEGFESKKLNELGVSFVQPAGYVWLYWGSVEPRKGEWKWAWADRAMKRVASQGLKVIPFFQLPKLPALHYDPEIRRDDPKYVKAFERYANAVTAKYARHPAWSGLVAVWGSSSDNFLLQDDEGCHEAWFQAPSVQVALLNAAYRGIKRASPKTIVIGFNLSTNFPCLTQKLWEDWFGRAFRLKPRFDWFGVHSYPGVPTAHERGNAYAGTLGLPNVRRFLDSYPEHRGKPIFVNEGGFKFGTDVGDLDARTHAGYVVENYIVARTLRAGVRGGVYFLDFTFKHLDPDHDYGLMSSLDQHDPPTGRPAWYALQTLIRTVGFFDYRFEAKLQGEYDRPQPFVYRFARPASKLWVIIWPRKPTPTEPRSVPVDISPAGSALLIDMLGHQSSVTASASGWVQVPSTFSPVAYLRVGKAPPGKGKPLGPRPKVPPEETKPGPTTKPPPPTKATVSTLKALLSPGAVVPPVKSSASGSFSATLSRDGTLAWKLSFEGLSGAATAAHLHAGARGEAGKIVLGLCKACAPVEGGKTKLRQAVLDVLLAEGKKGKGETSFYVDVHTAADPDGELRGQVALG